jgi:hypothetical protein
MMLFQLNVRSGHGTPCPYNRFGCPAVNVRAMRRIAPTTNPCVFAETLTASFAEMLTG